MATLAVSNFAPDARLTSGASSRGVPSRHLSSRALLRTSGGAGRLAFKIVLNVILTLISLNLIWNAITISDFF